MVSLGFIRRVFLLFVAGAGCVALVQGPAAAEQPATARITAQEEADTLAALKPPKRERPVVAVLGQNEGSETTDYLVPFGVLRKSGLADVFALSIRPGPVTLMPSLTIVPDMTAAEFDQRFPEGADYVIVPAMHVADDPAVLKWISAQAAGSATVVGVCAGALVLANAGVLHDRRATTHWFRVSELRKADSSIRYVADRRYVVDRGAATTTGVSASLPVSLAIVAAIGGRERADSLASELGVSGWSAAHDSSEFQMSAGVLASYATSFVEFWRHETVGIPVSDGVDEVALALTSNAYEATHLAQVETLAKDMSPVVMQNGLRLVPDATIGAHVRLALEPLSPGAPGYALDRALSDITERYGARTARVVRMELEYPERDVAALARAP
jgi:putative intracellular protease/amidase